MLRTPRFETVCHLSASPARHGGGTIVRTFPDRFPTILQVAVENKKPLSTKIDDYKAIIWSRADNLKDLPGLDGDCALMIIPKGKHHHGQVDAIALWASRLRR